MLKAKAGRDAIPNCVESCPVSKEVKKREEQRTGVSRGGTPAMRRSGKRNTPLRMT